MRKIIGLFVAELCFVFASYAGGFFSKVKQPSISDDDVGFARQYLQEALDWNTKLDPTQKTILENVDMFLDETVPGTVVSEEFSDLIRYITSDAFRDNLSGDNSDAAEAINGLEEKYKKVSN